MASEINRCMMRFRDRAERIERDQIIDTFVEVGPLLSLLESENNQLVYGRRGVGKTHALLYLADRRKTAGDHVIYVDCRNLGSNTSVYSDPRLGQPERATRMLVDVCLRMHEALLETVTDPAKDFDYSKSVPVLDEIADSLNRFKIVGRIEAAVSSQTSHSANLAMDVQLKSGRAGIGFSSKQDEHIQDGSTEKREGNEIEWIDFGNISNVFDCLFSVLDRKRIWIIIDEWSAIPIDLQPFLADLVRRTIFPFNGYTVKVGAIEHRSKFIERSSTTDYVGLEVGSDITPAIDLVD